MTTPALLWELGGQMCTIWPPDMTGPYLQLTPPTLSAIAKFPQLVAIKHASIRKCVVQRNIIVAGFSPDGSLKL